MMCACGKYELLADTALIEDADGQMHRRQPQQCDEATPLLSNYLPASYSAQCENCDWEDRSFTEDPALESAIQHSFTTRHSLVVIKSQRRFVQPAPAQVHAENSDGG